MKIDFPLHFTRKRQKKEEEEEEENAEISPQNKQQQFGKRE